MRLPVANDERILAARPPKQQWDPWLPSGFLVEPERTASGTIEDVATIFLTNRECPFRCTMCDLWKYTLNERVPLGAIPAQIDHALEKLPAARHIKLYNAGNFFDSQAIPPEDHAAIADRVRHFESVIVENHPLLTDERCIRFRDRLGTRLEVAIGLETVHPQVLSSLNKRMSVEDFDKAAQLLARNGIDLRVFLLLKPPGLEESEGIEWALRSLSHAFDAGATCCSIVPTRSGNGFMDGLELSGDFSPPSIRSMESVLEQAISRNKCRTFMDLWDVEMFFDCPDCGSARAERIRQMNLSQTVEQPVTCCTCTLKP